MNVKLNSTEVGCLLSCLKYYINPEEWKKVPFKKVKTEDSIKDALRLYNKINDQSKEAQPTTTTTTMYEYRIE